MGTTNIKIPSRVINGTYVKEEHDYHFYFRKTKSISINCDVMKDKNPAMVHIKIPHMDTEIIASAEQLRSAPIRTYQGESKFYLPVEEWHVIRGGAEWWTRIPT